MYDGEFAELYDLVHEGRGKDYLAEAEDIAKLIRSRTPDADSILDVACGTGGHLRHFAGLFGHAEGLELSPAMIAIAARRAPGCALHEGDMRRFELGRTFAAITCMFSSIGHLADAAELDAAIGCFARHTAAGGTVVVEPWWFPETFLDGYVGGDVVRVGPTTVARVSHSVCDGGVTAMEVHYVIAEPERGAHHLVEHHRITLFPRAAYETAFTGAGLSVEYLEGGPSGRGLFVGQVAA